MGILEQNGLQGFLKRHTQVAIESEPVDSYDNLNLRTPWGNLPVYPKVVNYFREVYVARSDHGPSHFKRVFDTETFKREFDLIHKFGGGVYPVFASVDLDFAGESFELKSGLVVPYLPFFSTIGEVTNVKEDHDWIVLTLGMKNGIETKIAISGGDSKSVSYAVSRTNFPDKYPIYQEKKFYGIHNTLVYSSKSNSYGFENYKSHLNNMLVGKVVLASKDPLADYAFCDLGMENGGTLYGYDSAWYTGNGVPVAHAVVIEDISF